MNAAAFASLTPMAGLCTLIRTAAAQGVLKRVSCAKPTDPSVRRATLSPIVLRGQAMLQWECFTTDNKALHRNLKNDDGSLPILLSGYAQINLITTIAGGECEYKRSQGGKETLLRGGKLYAMLSQTATQRADTPTLRGNDRKKQYILDGTEPFLRRLEVSDKTGRVHDKKQSKFRQINRFLELLRDVEDQLPKEGEIVVCDLCCGKSYLSFAVYHYLTVIRGREVHMTGVDLKADVIEHCSAVARDCGMENLHFVCADVAAYVPTNGAHVHLVISLHACDTATDLVLERALAWQSEVILSTPCCHHELNHALDCPELSCIAEHSMLRQKLCDAATDAMRLLLLEAHGYATAALELIDPDETPKNIMLRAIRKSPRPSSAVLERAMEDYRAAVRFFLRTPGHAQTVFLSRGNLQS